MKNILKTIFLTLFMSICLVQSIFTADSSDSCVTVEIETTELICSIYEGIENISTEFNDGTCSMTLTLDDELCTDLKARLAVPDASPLIEVLYTLYLQKGEEALEMFQEMGFVN